MKIGQICLWNQWLGDFQANSWSEFVQWIEESHIYQEVTF